MLIKGSDILGMKVLSLHVGMAIAEVKELIVDPDNLSLAAARVDGPLIRGEVGEILDFKRVREWSKLGLIMNSTDDLAQTEEIVRIKKILELEFELTGMKVETESGRKLGRVSDFVLETDNQKILQIFVARPVIRSLIEPELIIGRKQIKSISNSKVVVKEATEQKLRENRQEFVPNFVNPFREPNFAIDDNRNPGGRDIE